MSLEGISETARPHPLLAQGCKTVKFSFEKESR